MTGYFAEIWKLRHFWMALVRIDLRSAYRGSAIGMGGRCLHPIAMTTVLCSVLCQMFHADLRTYAPFVAYRPDVLGLHHGLGLGGLPVLLPGRIVHPAAQGPAGHLRPADHTGRRFPFSAGLRLSR